MKTGRKELKLRARRALLGNYPCMVGAVLMIGAIGLVIMIITEFFALLTGAMAAAAQGTEAGVFVTICVLGICMLTFLLLLFMTFPGWNRMYLDLCKGKGTGIGTVFWGFRNHGGMFFGVALVLLVIYAVVMTPMVVLMAAVLITEEYRIAMMFFNVYSVLIGAAGIYISLTYGLFYMILAEDPEKTVLQALEESRRLMKGNRGRLFMLLLSFLGWIFMAYLTLGIGLLWLIPYIGCTFCSFYLDVKSL